MLSSVSGKPAPARFCIGLDLGRSCDFSALASLEWPAAMDPEPAYACTTLKRWALSTPYMKVAAETAAFFLSLPKYGPPPLLVVDATGCGDAVYELIHMEMARFGVVGGIIGVTITGGSAVTQRQDGPARWNVAKKALVSTLQAVMGKDRLRVAATLPEAKTLLREFDSFAVKISPETGNESFESWRERDHDDLVLAVALACFGAERFLPAMIPEPMPSRLAVR